MIILTENWQTIYPEASIGLLVMDHVINAEHHPALEEQKDSLEQRLRERYAGYERNDLRALPTLAAYHQYYRQFKKSYHVQLQLESVAFKGKPIPRVASLVEAMFMSELDHLLLTAGHDLASVHHPLQADVATGNESFTSMNGQTQELKKDDMYIADADGILSTIIYGPDKRTKIRPDTTRVLFTVYGVPGINDVAVLKQLEDIRYYVGLVSPDATTRILEIFKVPKMI